MEKIRTGITRLTTGQCSRIAGGDPGMTLAGMGVGVAGGPMAVVTIGPPPMPDIALSGFDIWLGRTAGAAAGGAAGAFVTGALIGAELGTFAGPAGILVVAAVGGLVGVGAQTLLQYAANEEAYHGIPTRLRHATP